MAEHVIYKIGEVSARLGLVDKNSNTLRAWSEEFGAFLSALANPEPGQPRRFTPRDLQVLTAVRDYRANHLSYDEIRARLSAGEHDVAPASAGSHDGTADGAASAASALVPLAQVERLLAPLAASVEEWRRVAEEYRGRLEARESRIVALEQRLDDLTAQLGRGSDAARMAPPADTLPSDSVAHLGDAAARNGKSAPGDDPTPSLFPLPVRPPPPDSAIGAAPPTGPVARRRWWQLWR